GESDRSWSVILSFHAGQWSVVREFPGVWLVSMDVARDGSLAAVAADRRIFFLRYGVWRNFDLPKHVFPVRVRSLKDEGWCVTAASGYVAFIKELQINVLRLKTQGMLLDAWQLTTGEIVV